MLILARKVGESILIGRDGAIKISVVQIQGNNVRLGIEAPKDVAVFREEVFDAINRAGGD